MNKAANAIDALKNYQPLRLLSGLVAVGIGITAEFLLKANNFLLAAVLFAAAALLIVFAFYQKPGPRVQVFHNPAVPQGKWNRWGLICAGLAVLIAVLAFGLFTTKLPSIYPWLLHLASIGLFTLSVFIMEKDSQKKMGAGQPWSPAEIAIFVAIFAVAAFVRLYRFDQIPFGTWYDEADYGLNALRILTEPGYLPVYVPSTELPAHLIYLIALSFRILGISTLSIRAVSVVFGLATIPAGYLAGRELFNRKTGLVLAFFLAIARWDINWSRIGMHGVTLPFFELLTIGLCLRALRRQRLIDYALAGLTLGFGLAFYFSFRIFPLVIGLTLVLLFLTHRDIFKSSWRGLLIFSLGVFIASVPVTQLAVNQPDAFWARTNDVSIFKDKTPAQGWQAVLETTKEHLLMFNYHGDNNGRHNLSGEPMLDPIAGALLVLGLGLCLRRIRQPGSFLLLVWFLLMLVPGIFSLDFESPQSYRSIGSLPAVYLLATVPVYYLWQEWDSLTNQRRSLVFLAPLMAVLAVAGYINYNVYFNQQAESFDSWIAYSTPETITGKIMGEKGNQVDYYVSMLYYQTPTVTFLSRQVTDYHRLETFDSLPIRSDGKKGVVLILDSDRAPLFNQAKRYYPQATFKEYKGPNGNTVIYEVYLKPTDLLGAQGLTASYYRDADWSSKPFLVRRETTLNFDWKDGDPAPFPLGVEWQGILSAPTYGPYQLTVQSPGKVELYIDAVKVALKGNGQQTATVALARGSHTLKIRAEGQAGHFELDWQPPAEAKTPIPAAALFTAPVTNNGLLGRYYANGNWQGSPDLVQVDPWISFYYHNTPLLRPYTVVWEGQIKITTPGHYLFGLESIDESSLYIDGKAVIDDKSLNQYQESGLDLTTGLHPIQIHFGDRTGSTHIHFYWTPPNSDQEIVPQSVLFPPQADPELLKADGKFAFLNNPVPAAPQVKSGDASPLPVIPINLLWQTGSCGSGSGQLKAPHGIALDPQGNLWVADSGNQRVVALKPDGQFLRALGSSGNGNGQFSQPFDLVFEQKGSLVVLDGESPTILQRFTPDGKFQAAFGLNLGAYHPRGLGIDSSGNFYLADTGGSRIVRISPDGNVLQQWGNTYDGLGSSQPVSVAVAPDGAVFMMDASTGILWKLSPDGSHVGWPVAATTDSIDSPRVAFGPGQHILVTDPEKKRVVIYTSDGKPTGQLLSPPDHPTLLNKPIGIAVGANGVVYISDSVQCQVTALTLPAGLLK